MTIDHAATELALSSLEAAGFPGAARMRSNVARGLVGAADQAIKLAATWRHPGLGSAPAAGLDPATPVLDEWLYVTRERLAADTLALMHRLPPTVDAVCAIPRSGLLPGADLAAYLHLPLWECDQHSGAVRRLGHGVRMEGRGESLPRHVLLVDDTAAYGRAMRAAVPAVREAFPGAEVTRAVVYCHPQAAGAVDVCAAYYPGLHYLSYNWANAGHGALCGFDFDGILVRDDDPDQRPLYLPRRTPVPLIATGRHESARGITQAWLDRWGVRCDRLAMRQVGDPDDYSRAAEHKAAEYAARPDLHLFAESDPGQAHEINRLTGKAVLCPMLGRVLPPAPPPAPEPERPGVAEVMRLQALARECEWRGCKVGCQKSRCERFNKEVYMSQCTECRRREEAGEVLTAPPPA